MGGVRIGNRRLARFRDYEVEGKAEALIDARGNRVFGINLYSDLRPLFNEAGERSQSERPNEHACHSL